MTEQIGDESRTLLLLVDPFEKSFQILLQTRKLIGEDFGWSVHFLVEKPIVRRRKVLQENVALFV